MTEQLVVRFEEAVVGYIGREGKSRLIFSYAASWLDSRDAFALSLSLPLSSAPYDDDATRAFFNNLLPEQGVRAKVSRNIHISEKNVFGLLEALGGECAGAISITAAALPTASAMEKTGRAAQKHAPAYHKLTQDELGILIANLPNRPLLAGEEGVRLSLAGAQSKVPLVFDGKQYYLPLNGAASTHILKPPINDLDGSVENEAFTMLLARGVGLPVPNVGISNSFPRGYVVERYDRYVAEGVIRRLHQEDFCQALGVPPEVKYENEGGPGLKQCFRVLHKSADPVKDTQYLLMWVLFNFLVGNADTHAKNLSLLYSKDGLRLAPFYDLLCTGVYTGLTTTLAMKVGGRNDPDFIFTRHWERLATLAGVEASVVLDGLNNMATTLAELVGEAAVIFEKKYGASPVVHDIAAFVTARCNRTLQRLGEPV